MENIEKTIKNFEEQKEEKIQRFFKGLVARTPTLIAIVIGLWWIFAGTIKIDNAEIEFSQKITLAVATIVMALSYTSLIANGGFTSAKKTTAFQNAVKDWEVATKRGIGKQKEIIEYAKEMAKNNLYEVRKGNLERNLIQYEEIFNKDGDVICEDLKKYTRKQRKVIKKCMRLRIELPTIFGNVSSKFFGLKKEVTQAEYTASYTIKSAVIKSVISFISVGIVFNFIGFSVGSFIYALFQIAIWSGSGYMQRVKNYNFCLETLLPQIQEKTMIINSYLEKGDTENGNTKQSLQREITTSESTSE